VLGAHKRLARSVPEHERVESSEQQTGRRIIDGPRIAFARWAGGFERPARLRDRQRGPFGEIGGIAGAIPRAVAGADDRERLVVVDGRRRVGGMQQPFGVGDDQTLRGEPRDECVDWTLLERRMAALNESAQ